MVVCFFFFLGCLVVLFVVQREALSRGAVRHLAT